MRARGEPEPFAVLERLAIAVSLLFSLLVLLLLLAARPGDGAGLAVHDEGRSSRSSPLVVRSS